MASRVTSIANTLFSRKQRHESPVFHATPAQKPLSSQKPTFEHVEDIETILEDARSSETTIPIMNRTPSKPESRLLTLPVEIRLQIYGYLIDICPTSNCHLAPNPTTTGSLPWVEIPTYLINGRGKSIPQSFYSYSDPCNPKSKPNRNPNPPRIHELPTSFLLSNKQIYLESRHIPFETNNWIFANWFNSGLYSAITFTKAAAEWQRESMRFVGLEVGGVELVGKKGSCVDEWLELCGLWEGVRGLKLIVRGMAGGYGMVIENDNDNDQQSSQQIFIEKAVLDIKADWIVKGLSRMKSLRYLDITITDPTCSDTEKRRFRHDLEILLGSSPEISVALAN